MPEIINPFAEKAPTAFYIHVPFCHQKCRYCDFYSFVPGDGALQLYVSRLVQEIELTRKTYAGPDPLLHSIYFGGGTPSLLRPEDLAQILAALRANFALAADYEITLEANPESVNMAKLQAYRQLGVNRLSLGLQSTDNKLLKLLGRLHSYEDFLAALAAAQEAGFENISADLMFGLPGQSLQDFETSVQQVLELPLQHLSYYSLQLEEGTPLGNYFLLGQAQASDHTVKYLAADESSTLPISSAEQLMSSDGQLTSNVKEPMSSGKQSIYSGGQPLSSGKQPRESEQSTGRKVCPTREKKAQAEINAICAAGTFFPPLPAEDEERAMYHYLLDTLPQHGFQPYEISNAARPGYESRHNSLYWEARPYFASGPAAASYEGGLRHTRVADFGQWAAAIEEWAHKGKCPDQLFADQEKVAGPDALAEFFMLGFRMLKGVSLSQCEHLFGPGAWQKYEIDFSKLRAEGLICPTSQGYKLTRLGLDLANQVFMAFI